MERIKLFDVLKGIGIIAVVAGHSAIPDVLHKFIYMWHMPMFFLISGYFNKWGGYNVLIKNIKTLFLPYIVTCLFILFLLIVTKKDFIFTYILDIFTLRYYFLDSDNFNYCAVGPIWFLMALAWCRIIYNLIEKNITNRNLLFMLVGLISYLSIQLGRNIYIPLYFAQGISCLLFYHIGAELKRKNFIEQKIPHWSLLLAIIGIIVGLLLPTIWVYALHWAYWPVNVFVALCGILFLYHLSILIHKNDRLEELLAGIGRRSLLVLCVHSVDVILQLSLTIVKCLELGHRLERISIVIMMFTFCVVCTIVLSKISYVREIFGLKKL